VTQQLSEDVVRRAWKAAGWPDDLLETALRLNLPLRLLGGWVEQKTQGLERAQWLIPQAEELTFGTLRGREASAQDNDRFADLWANADEQVGDWRITVRREPNAFAQFRLQENVSIPVIEDQGNLVACVVWAKRNLTVGGQRLTVHCGQGLRVRRDCRGRGFGNLVRAVASAFWYPPTTGQYHYIRAQNFGAVNFFKHTSPRVVDSSPEREGDVPGIPVTVLQLPARKVAGVAEGIRRAQLPDIRHCVALINRTHRAQDLFRPYTVGSLEMRLDEGYWGPRASWVEHVYGWQDYSVVEEAGEIVACGGLWDRGRDMREEWLNTTTGERKTIDVAALLDFGFAAGHERAMARLIAYFINETEHLGRDCLLVPLQQLPRVAALLEEFRPVPDTRGLGWLLWDEESERLGRPFVDVKRPHTDLAYW
jgi:hypothetical protein